VRLVTVCECDEPFEKAPPFLEVKALHPLNEGVVQPFTDPGTSWNFHGICCFKWIVGSRRVVASTYGLSVQLLRLRSDGPLQLSEN